MAKISIRVECSRRICSDVARQLLENYASRSGVRFSHQYPALPLPSWAKQSLLNRSSL